MLGVGTAAADVAAHRLADFVRRVGPPNWKSEKLDFRREVLGTPPVFSFLAVQNYVTGSSDPCSVTGCLSRMPLPRRTWPIACFSLPVGSMVQHTPELTT